MKQRQSQEIDQEWLQLYNWQKGFCEREGISEWALIQFLNLPPSCIDYLKKTNRSIGEKVRQTIRELKEEDERIIRTTTSILGSFMTPQQRINEWWYYHKHELYRNYRIHGIQVTNNNHIFIQRDQSEGTPENDQKIINHVSDCLITQGHVIDDYVIQLVHSYYL
jgi:hypothetical protein